MKNSYLKMTRAKEHLNSLQLDIGYFIFSDPYSVSLDDDPENQLHIISFKLADVPPRIPLIAGDLFYCMRSALDQLVWSLAEINGIPDGTQFPLLETWDTNTRKRFESLTKGVPDEAVCEIKALQPYHRGDAMKAYPLWRLNEMCNLDKHRRIPANGSAMTIRFPNLSRAEAASIQTHATDDGGIAVVPLSLKQKMHLDPRISFDVNFGGAISGISENFVGITEIYDFIAEKVFPRFERFFA